MRTLIGAALGLLISGSAWASNPPCAISISGYLPVLSYLQPIETCGTDAQAAARGYLGLSGVPLTVPTTQFLGGSGGMYVSGTFGTGLTYSNGTASVLYGTGAGTALQGSLLGAASGAAPLDSSSLLPAANLRTPTSGTLGGVESLATVAHNFLTGIGTNGAPSAAQPAFTDISGSVGSAQVSGSYTGITGVGTLTAGAWQATPIANAYLANSSVTVNGVAISLGASGTVAAAAGTLTGSTLASGVTASSLTSLAGGVVGTAAYASLGTSGATVPELNGNNTWSGSNAFSSGAVSGSNFSLTGGTINGMAIGGTTPAAGAFTSVSATAGITSTNSQPITVNDGSGHLGAMTLTFPTKAALRAYTPTNVGANMIVAVTSGEASAGDGGGATFVWESSSSTTDAANVFYVTPSTWSGNGRWVLQFPAGGVSLRALDASCNGSNDDTAVLNNRFNIGVGFYPLGLTFFVPAGGSCYITGQVSTFDFTIVGQGSGMAEYAGGGNIRTPDFSLASGASQQPTYYGVLKNLFVMRNGISTSPPTTFEQVWTQLSAWNNDTSVGIKIGGDHVLLENVTVIGFNKAVYLSGYQFLKVNRLWVDGTNGFEYTNSGGEGDLTDLKQFPIYGTPNGTIGLTSGAVAAAGGGYTNGGTWTMSATGATCTQLPYGTETVVGGQVTAFTITDVGSCTAVPSVTAIATTDSNGGTGFTISPRFYASSERSGTGIYIHDKADGLIARGLTTEGADTGIVLSNVWAVKIDGIDAEDGGFTNGGYYPPPGGPALSLENCVTATLSNIYVGGQGIGADFSQKSAANGGSCSGADNGAAQVTVTNLYSGVGEGFHNTELVHLGSYSTGAISGLILGGPGYTGGASVVIDADAGIGNSSGQNWTISGVTYNTAEGTTVPWYKIDPTAAPYVSILTPATIVSITSGSTHTAVCNEIDQVNDTTALTITLPATCPLNQNPIVQDIGGHAGTDNITLSMPAGSTLNGASSQTISTNYGHANISYNGTSAFLQ